jgi:AraC family transcriptional regulator of adaptative response / DNA-3-methyladenine glycosylase II
LGRVILRARQPFDGAALLAFFAKRAVPGVEEVTPAGYRRSLRLSHGPGVAELEPAPGGMRVSLATDPRDRDQALAKLHALLDLDAPAREIDAALQGDPRLQPYRPGLRVPGTVDRDEIVVRAVLGQQISLRALAGATDLLAVPGIGPWTASYVALRTGDRDAFLPTDLGVKHALGSDAAAIAERWRPYRAYAVIQLWR